MADHFHHADNAQIFYIIYNTDTALSHVGAAHAEYVRFRHDPFQLCRHSSSMHIAGSLSGRHHYFHILSCSTARITMPFRSASARTASFSAKRVCQASIASTAQSDSSME